LQTSVFWLPYFPPDLRFHFNAHNLLVYGRDGDEYLVSDPVAETVVRCARADLEKARFAKGMLAPEGLLYYATGKPTPPDWAQLGKRALDRAARAMLRTPLPFVGVRGISLLAWQVGRLSDDEHARMYAGNIVRMQEEIGTGGAGFRFLYASFLQELAVITGYKTLDGLATQLVEIGDHWREFALASARMIRGRDAFDARALATRLRALAAREKEFFRELDARSGLGHAERRRRFLPLRRRRRAGAAPALDQRAFRRHLRPPRPERRRQDHPDPYSPLRAASGRTRSMTRRGARQREVLSRSGCAAGVRPSTRSPAPGTASFGGVRAQRRACAGV
jgi:hypothetical protein